jgi:hypothetical protein
MYILTNRVAATKWWIAPGTTTHAFHYIETHNSRDMTKGGWAGSASHPSAVFFYATKRWSQPRYYEGLQVQVMAVRFHGGVALRVDVMAKWLPRRTADQFVPLDVTSVLVELNRADRAAPVRRQLAAADARRLAVAVNDEPARSPGPHTCPAGNGFVDTFTFAAPGRRIVVHADVSCSSMIISVNGRWTGIELWATKIDRRVLQILRLPKNYGYSRSR